MEDGIIPDKKKQTQSFRWLQEIDQILVVGMKYGPRGTQEAVKRVRQLTPELVPAQVWHRMRHLREKERAKDATPVDWSEQKPPDFRRRVLVQYRRLFLGLFQHTLFQLLLALDAVPRPGHSFQALGVDFFTAGNAFPEAAFADAIQRAFHHGQ